MTRNPSIHHYLDDDNEHRARITGGNGEPLFVSSEGYKRHSDLVISQELSRQALNRDYESNRARIDAAMATRNGGSLANALMDAVARPVPDNAMSEYRDNALLRDLPNGGNALRNAIERPVPDNALINALMRSKP